MDEPTLVLLSKALAEDEEAGFQQFRGRFFESLERRRLDDCRALLEALASAFSPNLDREWLYHQALLYSELRQFDQAEVILRRLLADELSPTQRPKALLALAIQLDEQGQWPEAEEFYVEALMAYEATQDQFGQARTYNNLGICISFQVEQGQNDPERLREALSCHQAALSLAEEVDDQWEVARNWHGLGMAYGLMGQYSPAQDAFQHHITCCQRLDDPYDQAISLSDIAALVYQPQAQWAEAAAALNEAIQIFRGFDDDLNLAEALTRQGNLLAQQNQPEEALINYNEALRLAESIRTRLTAPTVQASYRATAEFIYNAPLSLYLRRGEMARAFTAAERARSRVLADLLGGQSAQPHTEIPRPLLEQQTKLRQTLDQAYAAEDPPTNLPDLEGALANLDRQIELLDPAYAGLESVAALTAEAVQERLPPDAALLAYAADAGDRLWILTLTSARVEAKPVPNVSLRWLRDFVYDHLDGVRRGNLVPNARTGHLSAPTLFPPLYKALIAPVWETLQAVRTVYIVPFGPLHYLPLGALTPNLNAPPPLLAAGRRVVYTPSATILLTYCQARPPSSRQGMLAVAPQDDQLRFTSGAAEAITRQDHDTALTGSSATRRAFLAQAGNHRLVCFLGHAVFDRRYPMSSRLKLAGGSLHASEILRDLRLDADLVILSACETGRSQVLRGDEILGLSRAVLYAGTPSLLAALWPVHEVSTRLLVERFIEQLPPAGRPDVPFDPALTLAAGQNWLRTLTCAEARAQLATWSELSAAEIEAQLTDLWQMTHPAAVPQAKDRLFVHPFFWSPYILIGDQKPG